MSGKVQFPPEVRFWAMVDKNGPLPEFAPELGNCWLWTGCTVKAGYGRFGFGGSLGTRSAHQFLIGRPPAGLVTDHLCRVRNCVRPSHLEFVTTAENVRRGAKGSLVTRCPQGHEYTPANTISGTGRRQCRACHIVRDRSRRKQRYVPHPLTSRTHCRRGHLLDAANTRLNGTHRRCRACHADGERQRRASKQTAVPA